MGKHGKYTRKYKASWEQEPWAKGWLKRSPNCSLLEAYCSVCHSELRAHSADLIKHSKTKSHLQKMRTLNPPQNQLTLNITINITNDEKERELRLAYYIAMHSSIRTIDHLGETIKVIGKNTELKNLKIHRTKCSSLIRCVIGPSLLENLVEDIGKSPFSLIVDESTDISTIKYLCFCIKYYSEKKKEFRTTFLGIVEVETCTAEDLYKHIKTFLVKVGLNINQLIGLGTDGANNLCGKNRSLFTLLKSDIPHLQPVRCICHSLNNAACHAADEMPATIDFLCREIFNWFSHSPLRRIEYRRLFDMLNSNKNFHQFVQLSKTRWLARYDCINTILEHFDEIKIHFSYVINKEKCYTARMLNEILNDNSTLLYLKVVKPIVYEVNKVNLIFQKDNVNLGKAYDDIAALIICLAKKIYKPQFWSNDVSIIVKNFENPYVFVTPEFADFGIEYINICKQIKIKQGEIKCCVENKCFNYINKLLSELIKRLPDNIELFKNLKMFSPEICLSPVTRCKFKNLPFLSIFQCDPNLFKMENQYNMLSSVNWAEIYGDKVFIDTNMFWSIVKNHKSADGVFAFEDISKFVLTILVLPSSNATVERVFSYMNSIKVKSRNKLKTDMLSQILRVKTESYSNNVCCKNFVITKNMLQKFTSDIMYKKDTNESDEFFETAVNMTFDSL